MRHASFHEEDDEGEEEDYKLDYYGIPGISIADSVTLSCPGSSITAALLKDKKTKNHKRHKVKKSKGHDDKE